MGKEGICLKNTNKMLIINVMKVCEECLLSTADAGRSEPRGRDGYIGDRGERHCEFVKRLLSNQKQVY